MTYIVVAVLLYFPFKRWNYADAPIIAALLWPVMVVWFAIGVPMIMIAHKIQGRI